MRKENWIIRASDMTVSERNKIFSAIREVERERERNGDYRKLFAYSFGKILPCEIEEKRVCCHKAKME